MWQHFRLAAGRVGAAAADGATLRIGIGSALRTHYANRIGQSGVVDPMEHAAHRCSEKAQSGGPPWTHL
jgi:hypothetical protein